MLLNQVKPTNVAQQVVQSHINAVTDGTNSPFRDMLSNGFNAVSHSFATISNVAGVARIHSAGFLAEACGEVLETARKLDEKNYHAELLRQLQAQQLMQAQQASTPQ